MTLPEMAQADQTAGHTPGPWHLCQHLRGVDEDRACTCGYRGVIYGPEHDLPMAVCQPGHDAEPIGQEGLGPVRYPREVEIANAHLIAAAPTLLECLIEARSLLSDPDAIDLAYLDEVIAKARGGAA